MRFKRPHLKVEQPVSTFAEGNARWTNKDLDPVPPGNRKWGVTSFIAYWISDAFNAATWQFAAGIIAVGLTWRESLGIVALAFFIISFVIALNGAIGVLHHVPFPVIARASWVSCPPLEHSESGPLLDSRDTWTFPCTVSVSAACADRCRSK
ncbi:uncharacterized protein HMPREF1541_10141 [Cyphellophora europaea CBS 101466]|uniref:NCS1 nucleoside transporter n=1 Tax=Cyphellophora europaea (strain CBS 101466) TaxID=1220924 RepID=W2S6Y9_CYPE1|nr:uncharacterized protein HMPREF1541_10141 [Cyphellophora europaea CBS 101466]ETN44471.1 hypothetical protein HMPREF1541_10141 [Cyphellophora europaea CBS 101466]